MRLLGIAIARWRMGVEGEGVLHCFGCIWLVNTCTYDPFPKPGRQNPLLVKKSEKKPDLIAKKVLE